MRTEHSALALIRFPLLVAPFILALLYGSPALAGDWRLNKESMTNVCHVQNKTTVPQLGVKIGEYDTQKLACQGASDTYDQDASNQAKCWVYGGGTIDSCKDQGVTLPPKSIAKSK